ncbi:MAG: hypothetical protein ACTS7D_00310 [Candidatus Hodgkinia cicadicola]
MATEVMFNEVWRKNCGTNRHNSLTFEGDRTKVKFRWLMSSISKWSGIWFANAILRY